MTEAVEKDLGHVHKAMLELRICFKANVFVGLFKSFLENSKKCNHQALLQLVNIRKLNDLST